MSSTDRQIGPTLSSVHAERHAAGARDAAEGRAQAGRSAALAGRGDRSERLRPDRESAEAHRRRRRGAGARAARALVEIPGIAGPAAVPDVVIGESADRGLPEQHRARRAQLADDRRVGIGNPVAEGLGAPSGRDAFGVEEVLETIRNAVERAQIDARAHERVRGVRLRQGALAGHGGEALELRAERFDAGEVDLRQPAACQRAGGEPGGKLPDCREGDVLVIVRNGLRRGPPKPQRSLRRRHAKRRQPRIEAGRHRQGIQEAHFAPGERGGDLPLQIADHLAAFGRSVGDAHDALGGLDVGYRNDFALHQIPRSCDVHEKRCALNQKPNPPHFAVNRHSAR